MGNKRKRRSRRVESQSSDRDANTSETSFTQGNATLVEVSEQNNHKMTQIEQQLNSNFEEILKRIRTNRESNLANDEEDVEDNGPSTSNPENKHLRRKHASNNEIDIDRNQDNRFQSSKMYELRQPRTSFGVANETLDDTIIINENRQGNADYHMMIGGLGIADYHRDFVHILRKCKKYEVSSRIELFDMALINEKMFILKDSCKIFSRKMHFLLR